MTRIVLMANNVDEVGGAQRVVHVVAQGLAERGHQVEVVGIAPFTPAHTFFEQPAYSQTTLMDEPWPAPPPKTGIRRHLPAARKRARLRSRLEQTATTRLADHLAGGPAGIVVTAQLWAMEFLARVPHDQWRVIGQYHSSFAAASQGRDLPRALSLYAEVDAFTLLTPQDADDFRRMGLNNTTWLPNPLAVWPEHVSRREEKVVTYLGRFSDEKGVAYLVDAWSSIAERHSDWSLRLVGSGPEEASLRARVGRLQKERGDLRVQFAPVTTDVLAEYNSAGVMVLPSLTEGLPLVLAEAMASGCACLASDCSPGVRMLTNDGRAAALCSRGNSADLAHHLSDLILDPDRRAELGERARAAMQSYRLDPVLDQWERLIATVLR